MIIDEDDIDITAEELEAALRGILTRVLHQIEEKK